MLENSNRRKFIKDAAITGAAFSVMSTPLKVNLCIDRILNVRKRLSNTMKLFSAAGFF